MHRRDIRLSSQTKHMHLPSRETAALGASLGAPSVPVTDRNGISSQPAIFLNGKLQATNPESRIPLGKTNEFPSPFSKLWSGEFVLGQEKVGAAQKGISVDTW